MRLSSCSPIADVDIVLSGKLDLTFLGSTHLLEIHESVASIHPCERLSAALDAGDEWPLPPASWLRNASVSASSWRMRSSHRSQPASAGAWSKMLWAELIMRSPCVAALWELKVTVGDVGCALVMDRRRRRRSAVPLPMSPSAIASRSTTPVLCSRTRTSGPQTRTQQATKCERACYVLGLFLFLVTHTDSNFGHLRWTRSFSSLFKQGHMEGRVASADSKHP